MSHNLDSIKNIISNQILEINITIEKENINNDKGLISNGIVDSYGFVELTIFLEQKFNITFLKEEINDVNFKSINSISNFIYKKIQKKE
tara:strand:+ start:492 stop:758 length:267 start_codon:yes stop_codon:yes gene_type:complete